MNGQNILGVMTGLGFFSNIDVNEPAAEERKTKTNVIVSDMRLVMQMCRRFSVLCSLLNFMSNSNIFHEPNAIALTAAAQSSLYCHFCLLVKN